MSTPPLNGCALLAAIPMFRADNLDHFIVVVDREIAITDRYVNATVRQLTDAHWSNGRYFDNREAALLDAYRRASLDVVLREAAK